MFSPRHYYFSTAVPLDRLPKYIIKETATASYLDDKQKNNEKTYRTNKAGDSSYKHETFSGSQNDYPGH